MNLSRINLNLLVVLDVLLQEKHVTRASQKLHVTQSTISASLSQLRDIFDDELLIREKNHMVLTPKASLLAPKVRSALSQLETSVFNTIDFDPAKTERSFTLAMNDALECLLLPELTPILSQQAPGIELIIQHADTITDDLMNETGGIDLGYGTLAEKPASHISAQELFVDQLVCAGQQDNPVLQQALTLESYLSAEHLSLSNTDLPHISDELLAELGRKRKISLSVTHVSTALYLLASSGLIATLPLTLVKKAKPLLQLTQQALPFTTPTITTYQVWHKQYDNDQAHRWLRELIQATLLARLQAL